MAMGQETVLKNDAFLVSETDSKGFILFANEEFCEVAEFSMDELAGKPHSLVRHPDMPKAAFADLWSTVKSDEVWQGYVKNRTKSGGYYWVYATVYPFKNDANEQCYMSIRRKASQENIDKSIELYKNMK